MMIYNNILSLDFDMKFYVYTAYLILIPLFFFLGMYLSRLRIATEYKYNVFTILYGLVPIGIILPFYLRYEEYQNLLQYPLVLGPFSMFLWAFISSLQSPVPFNWGLMVICFCLALPLGFILPLAFEGLIPQVYAYTIISFLSIFPLAISGYFLYIKVKNFTSLKNYERNQAIKSWTCYNPALFLIMVLFIFSEGSLVYIYSSQTNSPVSGAVIGMIGIIVLIYIVSSITIQLKLNMPDMRQNNTLKLKVQISFCIFCSILVPICIIIAFAVDNLGEQFTIALTTVAISLVLLGIIGIAMTQIKYSHQKTGTLLIVIVNVTIWVFLVLPLGVILPSALSQATTNKKRNKIIGVATVFLGLVFMIGVSLVSIIYNIYKKRMEKEELAIFCCDQTKKVLNRNFVRVQNKTIRNFYDIFAYHGYNKDIFNKEVIENQNIYILIDAVNKNQRNFYEKEFLLTSALDTKGKKQGNYEADLTEKIIQAKPSFWMLLNIFDSGVYTGEAQVQNQDIEEMLEEEEIEEKEVIVDDDKERKTNGLFDFDVEDLEIVADSYIDTFRMPSLNFNHIDDRVKNLKGIKNIDKEKKLGVVKNIATMRSKDELIMDRSKRKDWLGVIFDIFAKDPYGNILEPWMSEAAFLYFVRIVGFVDSLLSDQQLIIYYISLTIAKTLRPLTKKVFVNEVIPWLSQKAYPEFEVFQQESKFVTSILYPIFTKNYLKIFEDPNYWDVIDRRDIIENTFDVSQIYDDKIVSGLDKTDNYTENNWGKGEKGLLSSSKVKKPFKCSDYFTSTVNYFKKLGKKITNYGMDTSRKIEKMLQKQYSIEKKDDNKTEVANEIKESNRKQTLIQIKTLAEAYTIMIDTILQAKKKKEVTQEDIGKKITLKSLSNIIAIISKIIEFIQLSAIGFKKEINWKIYSEPLAIVSDSVLIENNHNFLPVFWTCFVLAGLYCPLAWQSWKSISLNRLGRDKSGVIAKFCSFENLKKRFMNMIGSLLYMFILKSQLSVFACNINIDPPVVWNTNIVCYQSLHIGHFFSALVCICAYYPIATFIFPLLQFTDASLEIKFETTFVILLSQIKLFITGITVFLPYQYYLKYQLAIASVALGFIFLYSAIKQPCIAKKLNVWFSLGYFIAFVTNVLGFVNYMADGSLIVNYAYYGICSVAIVVAGVVYWVRIRKMRSDIRRVTNLPLKDAGNGEEAEHQE
ncbi:hypothetical protein SteCoe_16235 [Stentor coeruleus]|uniref:Uncharacterized protein n=1 Tax=Stentor coeruleus TaxID=5963 RepID=A0A1R2C1V0_9CILI|nr:hypothetical protein SteCoe_16235 [Stentor coeruleus]